MGTREQAPDGVFRRSASYRQTKPGNRIAIGHELKKSRSQLIGLRTLRNFRMRRKLAERLNFHENEGGESYPLSC